MPVNVRVKPAAFTIRGIFGHLARLRFINISPDATVELMLAENRVPTRWISVANDGADLPPPLRVERVAKLRFSAGQTYDFLWTPASRGTQLSTSTVTTFRIMPAKEPLSLASQFEAWFGFGITVIGVVFLFLCNRGVRGKDFLYQYFPLSVVMGWKFVVAMVVALSAANVLLEGQPGNVTRWSAVAIVCMLNVLMFLRIGHHLKGLAREASA